MRSSFTIRMELPPDWYEMARDDPGAWLMSVVPQLLPTASTEEQDQFADSLIDEYGLVELLSPTDALVHVPEPSEGVRAVLLTYPWSERSLLRRGVRAYAVRVERMLRWLGSGPVQRTDVVLPTGPAVRLRAVCTDELSRPVEQVLHVVLADGAAGAVVLRMQWPAGRPDADALAEMADRVAHGALVEAFA